MSLAAAIQPPSEPPCRVRATSATGLRNGNPGALRVSGFTRLTLHVGAHSLMVESCSCCHATVSTAAAWREQHVPASMTYAATHRDKQAPTAQNICCLNPCLTCGFMEVYVVKRRFSLTDPEMSTFQLSASSS